MRKPYSGTCGSYRNFIERQSLLIGITLNRVFRMSELTSTLRLFYGRHHNLINRYGISMSQMTTDMFHYL